MNKKIKIFLVCSIVCILLGGFAGCKNLNTTLEDTVSEIHEKVFFANDDNFFVQVTSGQIEKDYALDGKKGDLKNFVSIKVVAKQSDFDGIVTEFDLQNKKYSQVLTSSPVDSRTWTCMIDGAVQTEGLTLSVVADEQKSDYQLQKAVVGETRPIDILKKAFEKELLDCFDGKTFLCETTVRLVKSPDQSDDKYFWYVVVYKQDKNYFGFMADSVTGEIVAKKS